MSMDEEFEPTVDMMVNDFDDEGTLDEAEAGETPEQQKVEADMLQQEQDMPIEKLLAMYGGYPAKGAAAEAAQDPPNSSGNSEEPQNTAYEQDDSSPSSDEGEEDDDGNGTLEDDVDGDEVTVEKKPEALTAEQPGSSDTSSVVTVTAESAAAPRGHKRRRSALSVLYPELARKAGSGGDNAERRALRSEDGAGEEGDDSECSDEGDSGDEGSWRKTIMIGSVYQAQVPDGLSQYGDSRPYENDDKLLWQPTGLSADAVEQYLRRVQEARLRAASGVGAIPNGAHTRDHEEALYLFQQCDHNAEEAFRRSQMNSHQPTSTLALWSEEECANFENGLRFYGKDFYTIQQHRVRTRSVGELVQFYYLWKKTERHDVFANKTKLEKRKYALNPGVTDYMERFLEEQDREPSSQRAGDGPSLQILMATSDSTASGQLKWSAESAPSGTASSYPRQFSVDVPVSAHSAPLVPP